ncbi:MAG: 1-phosphofructokinase family hexose kinase [Clostridiales Family XIII bacterium]|jgi:1-phosphofructokinase|nr:1-phosphofructokinase family hexose kinase [Clostridiales Family XIII bacterium]
MIVTVTLNPAIDKTAEVERFNPGGLNRLGNIVLDAGGKGVNVSKALYALGGRSVATGFLGDGGSVIKRMLGDIGIESDFVPVHGIARTNLKVLDDEAVLTELNEPGALVTDKDISLLREKLMTYAAPDTIFVFAGSLPPGADARTYASMIETVKSARAKVFLDADGEALRAALENATAPDFLKPNVVELMEYMSLEERPDSAGVAALCRKLIRDKGVGKISVSMGAEGAVFADAADAYWAPGLNVEVHSAVGAGDSMVAAFALCEESGASFKDAARLAMAVSAGAVTTKGTKAPSLALVNELLTRVELQRI